MIMFSNDSVNDATDIAVTNFFYGGNQQRQTILLSCSCPQCFCGCGCRDDFALSNAQSNAMNNASSNSTSEASLQA
jgi:hypothetical protein